MANDDFSVLGKVSLEDDASPVLQNVNSNMSQMGMVGTSVAVAIGMALEQFVVGALQFVEQSLATVIGDLYNAGTAGQMLVAVLGNLTGGAGQATLDWADSLAEKTGVSRDVIASMVEKQIELGQSTAGAEALTEAMVTIGEATGASSDAIAGVTERLSLAGQLGTTATLAVRSAMMQGIDLQPIMLAAISSISGTTMTTLAQADTYLNKHKDAWSSVFTYIEQNAPAMYGKAAAAVEDTWQSRLAQMQAATETIFTQIGTPVMNALTTAFAPLFSAIQSFASSPAATSLFAGIGSALAPLLALLQPIVGMVDRFLFELEAGSSPLDAFKDSIGKLIPPGLIAAIMPVVSALETLFGSVKTSGPEVWAIIEKVADALGKDLARYGPMVMDELAKGITNLATFWSQHGTQIVQIIGTIIAILGALAGVAAVVLGALAILFEDVVIAVTGVEDNLIMQIPNFIHVGASFVEGLISGIEAGIPALIAEAVKAVVSAWDAAKKAVGISSPSTAFAEIGQNMMLGMSQGIQGATAGTMAVATGATQSVATAASGVGAVGGVVVCGGDNSSRTINIGTIQVADDFTLQTLMSSLRTLSST